MSHSTHVITRMGLVAALGLAFPWVLHMMGAGQVAQFFLPMFLPIVGGAFFLPVGAAVFVGAVTPFLSTILTGMPPLVPPVAPIMMVELVVMTGFVALLYQQVHLNAWITLVVAVIADRLILAVLAVGLGTMLGLPPSMVTWGAVAAGLPGITLLFVVIPPLVARLNAYSIRRDP